MTTHEQIFFELIKADLKWIIKMFADMCANQIIRELTCGGMDRERERTAMIAYELRLPFVEKESMKNRYGNPPKRLNISPPILDIKSRYPRKHTRTRW